MPNVFTQKGGNEMAKKRRTIEYEESSGNVFADLGLPNPDQELLKANLMLQILRAINARKLTQAKAGKILGIPQPHVSDPRHTDAQSTRPRVCCRRMTASRSGQPQLPPDDARDEAAAGIRAVDEREDAASDVVTAVNGRGGLDRVGVAAHTSALPRTSSSTWIVTSSPP
jgi:predicted XRE-type DNA-binding protein